MYSFNEREAGGKQGLHPAGIWPITLEVFPQNCCVTACTIPEKLILLLPRGAHARHRLFAPTAFGVLAGSQPERERARPRRFAGPVRYRRGQQDVPTQGQVFRLAWLREEDRTPSSAD